MCHKSSQSKPLLYDFQELIPTQLFDHLVKKLLTFELMNQCLTVQINAVIQQDFVSLLIPQQVYASLTPRAHLKLFLVCSFRWHRSL